jgi:hypothetical protein
MLNSLLKIHFIQLTSKTKPMKKIFLACSMILIILTQGCAPSGPTTPVGTTTITVDCESGVCAGRPAIKISVKWTGGGAEFLICCKDMDKVMSAINSFQAQACGTPPNVSAPPVTVGSGANAVEISPYQDTGDGATGVRMKQGSNDYMFVCGAELNNLISKINAVLPSCCIE